MIRIILSWCLLVMLFVLQINAQNRLVSEMSVITTENANNLREVNILGRGVANVLDWHPSGEMLAVGSATGVWFLNETLEAISVSPIKQHIIDLAWSPNGLWLAVASNLRDRCFVQIWDANFSGMQFSSDTCGAEINWSSDSEYLAVFDPYSGANEVKLIAVMTNEVTSLQGQDGAWSPSGDHLFTRLRTSQSYSGISTISVWDVLANQSIYELDISNNSSGTILWGLDEHILAIQCDELLEDSDRITIGICSLDVRTGDVMHLFEITSYLSGQALSFIDQSWNDNETLLASVHERFTPGFLDSLVIYDTETTEVTNIGHGTAYDWKPQENIITAVVANGEVRNYNALTGEILADSQYFTAPINMIALRANSNHIASTGFGYEINTSVWDINSSPLDPLLSFYVEPAEIVDYTPDGNELVAGGTIRSDIVTNQNIDAFNSDTGEWVRDIAAFYEQGSSPPSSIWNADYSNTLTVPENIQLASDTFPAHISWSPNYSIIAIVEQSIQDIIFRISTWNARTGEPINRFAGGMFGFVDLIWSPDNTHVAVLMNRSTGSGNHERGLRVFSAVAGENYEFDRNDYEVFAWTQGNNSSQRVEATWNRDGSMLAVVLPDSLEIHALDSVNNPLVSLPAYDIVDLEWSSDDRFIAAGGKDGVIRLYSVDED